ncbi:MAG: hypothetical protein HQL29_04080, partial [Candidatus Omnitrophica bacterium]|nr:hypothetical protein [Candidatus Omnitrophota bacterium]
GVKIRFVEEIDSDVWGLSLMNEAGFDVLEAKKFFDIINDIDKVPDIISSTLTIADEHLPTEKRIRILTESIDTANWPNTGNSTAYSKIAMGQIWNSTDKIMLTREACEDKDFEGLKSKLDKMAEFPEYMTVMMAISITNLAKKSILKALGRRSLPGYMDEIAFIADDDMLKEALNGKSSMGNEKDLRQIISAAGFTKARESFRKEYLEFLDTIANRFGADASAKVRLYVEAQLIRIDVLSKFDFNKRIKDVLFNSKTIDEQLSMLAALKDRSLMFMFDTGLPEVKNGDLYKRLVLTIWNEILAGKEIYSWNSMEEILYIFEDILKYADNRVGIGWVIGGLDVKTVIARLLRDGSLTDEEKIEALSRHSYLLRDSDAFGFVCGYYGRLARSDDKLERLLLGAINNINHAEILLDKFAASAIDELLRADTRLIDLTDRMLSTIIGKTIRMDTALLRMYNKWEENKSEDTKIQAIEALIRYYSEHSQRTLEGDVLSDEYLRRLDLAVASNNSYLDDVISRILKDADIAVNDEAIALMNVRIKACISLFAHGGIVERESLYSVVMSVSDKSSKSNNDIDILSKFLNSSYLREHLENKYGIKVAETRTPRLSDKQDAVSEATHAVSEYMLKEMDTKLVKNWGEYILFINMRALLNSMGIFSERDGILNDLQNTFGIFFAEDSNAKESDLSGADLRKIRANIGRLFGYGDNVAKYKNLSKGKEADSRLTKKYEPLLTRLWRLPFYFDRSDLLDLSNENIKSAFNFIFNLKTDFDELLSLIVTYLPQGYFRNYFLYALLSREAVRIDPGLKDPLDINAIGKLIKKDAGFADKAKRISVHLNPDIRLYGLNTIMLGYFAAKARGSKKSGIGAIDEAVQHVYESRDVARKTKTKLFDVEEKGIYSKQGIISMWNNALQFAKRFNMALKTICPLILAAYYPKVFTIQSIEGTTPSLKIKAAEVLRKILNIPPIKEIFAERRIDANSIGLEENEDKVRSILINYFYEKLHEMARKEGNMYLRKLILAYLENMRKKSGTDKIDIFYFDLNHTNKLAQMDSVVASLVAGAQFDRILASRDIKYDAKLNYITEELFADSQPARDAYLEKLIEKEINDSIGDKDKLLALRSTVPKFFNQYLKNKYLLKSLETGWRIEPEMSLDREISLVKELFPEKSSFRDDILKTILEKRVKLFEDFNKLNGLFYGEKRHILEDKKQVENIYYEEKIKIIFENMSANEKKDFALWVLGAKDMPILLREYEAMLGVSFNRFKEMYNVNAAGARYTHAGESFRKTFIEEMFLGPSGIMSNDKILAEFSEQMLSNILKKVGDKTISKKLIRNVFYAVMEESNPYRRLEIIKALSVNLASTVEGGTTSSFVLVPRLFESLGIIGIKSAQILAFSTDIDIPEKLRQSLKGLGSKANPLTKIVAFKTLSNMKMEDVIPVVGELVGSASIKVVFEAINSREDSVALKLKRPEVAHHLKDDMEYFKRVCSNLRSRGVKIPEGFEHRASEGVERDADFIREIENSKELEKDLLRINKDMKYKCSTGTRVVFAVPWIDTEHSNDKVIISRFVRGDDMDGEGEKALIEKGVVTENEMADLKGIIFDFLMTQLLSGGYAQFLSDPHGGNFRITKENGEIKVYLIDVGAMEPCLKGKEIFKDMLTELAFIQHGIKASDKYVWLAVFFSKTGYLTSSMNKIDVLRTMISKMDESDRPYKDVNELLREVGPEIASRLIKGKFDVFKNRINKLRGNGSDAAEVNESGKRMRAIGPIMIAGGYIGMQVGGVTGILITASAIAADLWLAYRRVNKSPKVKSNKKEIAFPSPESTPAPAPVLSDAAVKAIERLKELKIKIAEVAKANEAAVEKITPRAGDILAVYFSNGLPTLTVSKKLDDEEILKVIAKWINSTKAKALEDAKIIEDKRVAWMEKAAAFENRMEEKYPGLIEYVLPSDMMVDPADPSKLVKMSREPEDATAYYIKYAFLEGADSISIDRADDVMSEHIATATKEIRKKLKVQSNRETVSGLSEDEFKMLAYLVFRAQSEKDDKSGYRLDPDNMQNKKRAAALNGIMPFLTKTYGVQPAKAKETLAQTQKVLISGIDEKDKRQKDSLEAFGSTNDRDIEIRVVQGVPLGQKEIFMSTANGVGRELAKNNYGIRDGKKKIFLFEINPDSIEETERNMKNALDDAEKELPLSGRIVIFKPQLDGWQDYSDNIPKSDNIMKLSDAYTDYDNPDMVVRMALARNLAYFISSNDAEAFGVIKRLLVNTMDADIDISTIDDLLNLIIKIRPVVYNDIAEFYKAQIATAISA